MPYKLFLKLKNLVENYFPKETLLHLYKKHMGDPTGFELKIIPHEIYLTTKDKFPYSPLPKNEDTAELIAIMLGDGHIAELRNNKKVQITLNKIDEERYFKYVGRLLKRIFPNSNFRITKTKGKGYDWKTVNSRIHYAICELGKGIEKTGLIPGDKVKNQVSIPEWILSKKCFIIMALKGLFDTDGSIAVSRKNQLTISFTNSSKKLVEDFFFMCEEINIHSGDLFKVRKGSWRVSIHNSKEIKKFLNLIKPEKINEPYHFKWLGLNVIYRRSPKEIKNKIRKDIEIWKNESVNPNPNFSYTRENTKLIKSWLENRFRENKFEYIFGHEFNGIITINMIKSAFNTALFSQYELISYSKKKNSEKYRVHWFPEIIRNNIIDFCILEIEAKNETIVSKYFEDLTSNPSKMASLNPFNYNLYNEALEDYVNSIILILKEIYNRIKKGIDLDEIGYYSLYSHFKRRGVELAFGRKPIRKILLHVKEYKHFRRE
ncbi:MAG: hypothetical protein GF311_00600 [Candidatus Lokiarchaeota archaeon]|nr:hypothetical protein [Candidatus Lokiarchaeota archaeon]